MNMFAYAAMLCIVAPISWMVWLAVTSDRAGVRSIRTNLTQQSSTASRQTVPAAQWITMAARRLTPDGYVSWLDKQIAGAGRPKEWPLARILVVKPMLALAGAGVGVLL